MPQSPVEVFASFVAAGGAPVNAAETVVATTRAVASPFSGASFLLEFFGQLTPGASTTAATYRIRRDGVAGTVIATSPALTVVAAQPITFALVAVDATLADVAGQQWVLTCVQTAGAGNGATANVTTKVSTPV